MKLTTAVTCLFVALTFIAIPSIAQPPDTLWTQTFGEDSDGGKCVQQTTDGGYIITGSTAYTWGYSNAGLIKTDPDGNELWCQVFNRSNDDHGNSVQQTIDGGYIVTGYTRSPGPSNFDVWLIKTDSLGDVVWHQTFGGIRWDKGNCVQQTTDGGYIITGYTRSVGAGGEDVWLIKTDSFGDVVWHQTFGGMRNDCGKSVQQTTDGGYIITGYINSFGASRSDIWLIKTDANGNEIWNQTFGGTSLDYGYSVQQTSDDGYIITGSTRSFGAGGDDLCLIKTDHTGDMVWSQTFGGTEWDRGYCGQQTTDGGYIVTGLAYSFGAGNSDVWLIKTDSLGNEMWNQTFGGTSNDYGYSVQQTTDGGYIIVGKTYSFSASNCDIWLIRVAAEGTEVTENTKSIPTEYLLDEVYPNPFNPTATITIALPKPSELRVSIFNTLGQEVAVLADGQYAQGYQQFTFDATGLSSGIYFVRATVPGQMNEMRKVVFIK